MLLTFKKGRVCLCRGQIFQEFWFWNVSTYCIRSTLHSHLFTSLPYTKLGKELCFTVKLSLILSPLYLTPIWVNKKTNIVYSGRGTGRHFSHVTRSRFFFKNLDLRRKADPNFCGYLLENHFRHLKLYSNPPGWLTRMSSTKTDISTLIKDLAHP